MPIIVDATECYQPLLTKLALQLGMSKQDSQALVEAVILKGSSSFPLHKDRYTLKAWLTKLLVHDCVFKLSNVFFSEGKNCMNLCQPANGLWACQTISLSGRIIYLLCNEAGFSEYATAQILNSNSAKVRVELAKARQLLAKGY